MTQGKTLNIVASLGVGVAIAAGMLFPSSASAQTITLDEAMLARCEAEGIAPPACACWLAEIADAEGVSELTEDDVDAVAASYQEELQACINAN